MDTLKSIVIWLCVIGAIGGGLRLLLFKIWTVPDDPVLGASLAPTLRPGDVVVLLTRGDPSLGDLVRCPDPEEPHQFVVGRISGGPGDLVETVGRTLVLNGTKHDADASCQQRTVSVPHPDTGSEIELSCDVVTLGGGWHYRASSSKPTPNVVKTNSEVGTGKVFLLSDNREFHDDSRDYGQLPAEACKERIFFRLWGKKGWDDTESRLSYIR